VFERCAWLLLLAAAVVHADEPRDGAPAVPKVMRDPMQPYRPAAGAAAGGAGAAYRFNLTGVLISPSRRVAIVNGRPQQIGDRVDGAVIVSIEPETVHLQQGSDELLIHLGRPGNGERPTEGASAP
jgi:hypothetical protein